MNDVARIHTAAETSLFEAFEQSGLTGKVRTDAIEALKRNGLPTRKVEPFHYTDLRARLRGEFKTVPKPANDVAKNAGAAFPRLVSTASVQHFRDGFYIDFGEALPAGVTIEDRSEQERSEKSAGSAILSTVADAASTVADAVAGLAGREGGFGGAEDALVQVNSAFLRGNLAIEVASGVTVEQTVGLAHTPATDGETVSAMRWSIDAGANSMSRFVERGVGRDGQAYLTSYAVDLTVGDGATVDYVISNEEGDAATRLARFSARLGKDATLNLFLLNAGGALVRQELQFVVEGEGAKLNIGGVNLVGGEAHIDVTSRIDHLTPGTGSEETFRNVCTGEGVGVFQGQINVAQAAQQTDARMACNSLLLSDACEFNAKPELEIFADDVQCAHGATVADLEESYVFYLRSRGISEAVARRMLIKAFVAEVLEGVGDEELAGALEGRIDGWMERHI